MTNESKSKPAHEIRLGSVRATLWANRSDRSGAFFSVTFTRLYKSGDAWKRSESFGRNELPLVKQVAEMAIEWITQQAAVSGPAFAEPEPAAEA